MADRRPIPQRLDAAIEVRERACAAAIKAGETDMAVLVAVWLARDHRFRDALSVASAWLSRADRLLEGVPENPGHGWAHRSRRAPRKATAFRPISSTA